MWQWISDYIIRPLEWANTISILPAAGLIVIGLLAARPRRFAINAIMLWSFIPALACWCLSVVFLYATWGWTGLIIGLAMCVIGTIPLALIALAINGMWSPFGVIAYYLATFIIARLAVLWMAIKYEAQMQGVD